MMEKEIVRHKISKFELEQGMNIDEMINFLQQARAFGATNIEMWRSKHAIELTAVKFSDEEYSPSTKASNIAELN